MFPHSRMLLGSTLEMEATGSTRRGRQDPQRGTPGEDPFSAAGGLQRGRGSANPSAPCLKFTFSEEEI